MSESVPPPHTAEKKAAAPPAAQEEREAKPQAASPFASRTRTRRVAPVLAALALIAGAVWYFAIRTPEPKDDLGRFQGTWQLVPSGPAKRFPVVIKVTGDQWAYTVAEQEQKRYRITLRPEADPKEIDLTQLGPDGQQTAFVLRGIYAFANGGAKVLTAPGTLPRPTTFDTTDESPVLVLERP